MRTSLFRKMIVAWIAALLLVATVVGIAAACQAKRKLAEQRFAQGKITAATKERIRQLEVFSDEYVAETLSVKPAGNGVLASAAEWADSISGLEARWKASENAATGGTTPARMILFLRGKNLRANQWESIVSDVALLGENTPGEPITFSASAVDGNASYKALEVTMSVVVPKISEKYEPFQ
jgi:hypothetical protein